VARIARERGREPIDRRAPADSGDTGGVPKLAGQTIEYPVGKELP
jgi:hypothetical protein